MNRFRKNKKVKETLGDLENAPSSSPFSLKPSKKKDAVEPKPDLDLSAALPSTDDFRTSLLMPKLSARFSMLREQDDPDSKLGKASDDSVLFPRRASRLNLFGHNPSVLADIDEVSSNDGSRPSIALGRTDSYASGGDGGYGTDDDRSQNGSIMSRARRAEGNNLFGGRQKVYRIPVRSPAAGASSNSSEGSRGMGKFVYDHDLNMSAFQRMRQKEKEERLAAEEAAHDSLTPESEDATSTVSSTNRTTNSSTASGPATNARTSTAATSIDEAPLNASQTQAPSKVAPEIQSEHRLPSAVSTPRNGSVRSRRLYGRGLTQSAQNQQHSTLTRLESLSRQRSGTSEFPLDRNFSRSATNLRDRLQKLAIVEPASKARPTSPPLFAASPIQIKPVDNVPEKRISPTAASFGAVPPLSPPSSETDDGALLLAAALNPADYGKATAMGLFNRPATGFDEQQFSRRQLQMHQGRDTPPLRRPSPPRRAPQQEPIGRPRGLSKSSYRSRAESASSHYSSDAHHAIDHSRASSVEASPSRPGVKTFYANSTASESGDEGEDRRSYEVSSITSVGTDYGHSLHHSSFASKPPTPTGEHLETLPEVRYSDLGDLKPIEENDAPEEVDPTEKTESVTPERPDSPTFGVNGPQSHLRNASDKSVATTSSPTLPEQDTEVDKSSTAEFVPENPRPMSEKFHDEATSATPAQPDTSSHGSSSAQSSDLTETRTSEDSSIGALPDTSSVSNVTSWKEEMTFHHRRDGSTETQKEREEFAIELAERRRKVQEKLRSVAEDESRSSSPTPGWQTPDSPSVKAGNAFSLLKQKSSKPGLSKYDQKSNKMYGYNSSSSPALVSEDSWREEERPSFNFGRQSNSTPQIPSERSFRSRKPTISRDESRESSRSRGPSPQSSFRAPRDRSGSDASGRSKSRTRYRERDDLETVEEGSVIAHENFVIPDNFEPPVPVSVPNSARPSMEAVDPVMYDRSSSASSGRYRSASRSGTPSFQFERPFQFSQSSNPPSMIGVSPRPSPATPAYSANATPPLHEIPPDQSPVTSLASATSNAHTLPQRAPGQNMLQKRAVNKKLISEPTFVSSTSNVPVVGLPAGAAPPVPPMNPRRRRGTQTILNAFKADRNDSSRISSPAPSISDEHSVFPDDEKRPMSRNRLRKTSSEGGNLNSRARQEAMAGPPPSVPQYPPPAIPVDGGMF
ncbi:uncharacterized protein N7459_009191 [Penicillium hispanicum]|uniref:uncharacterized protein n=1 Tax=Penicillium hispanicum TaxID=1080232 RepID=UPI00253FE2D9|nr:uncharacterized protein N7459_009191 [Penicillium hispanicum]KAJ5569761.1 hypothetical protein N7459_009191 [Penicillium hispanicum]